MLRRPDGRSKGGTLRPLACEMSCLHRADGSALWKAGATHVLAAVHGPVAPRQPSKEDSFQATVTVLFKSGTAVTLEREWEAFLSKILSASIDIAEYPRTVIQIVLQVIQADGGVLACSLHAAVASLLDAGIAMKSLPIATTCLLSTSQPLRLDPTDAEEGEDASVLVLVNDNSNPDKLIGCQTMGRSMSTESLLECMQAASRASPAVVAFWRLAVEQKVTRQSQTLWSF